MLNNSPKWDNGKPTQFLRFPNKKLRSAVIARYVQNAGYKGVVVFTCGNAATALRRELPSWRPSQIVEVGPKGVLQPSKWFTPEEIHQTWPDLFDATSGHLPLPLMVKIAHEFKYHLDGLPGWDPTKQYYVPTGSGETIICLRLAYPETAFCAVYDNSCPATTRDNDAPLNEVVDKFFPVEYWHGQLAL